MRVTRIKHGTRRAPRDERAKPEDWQYSPEEERSRTGCGARILRSMSPSRSPTHERGLGRRPRNDLS